MRLLLVLALLIVLPACTPYSVTFTFGADDGRLVETAVINEPSSGGRIALIDVRGLISESSPRTLFSAGASPVDELVARLARAEADPDIKAVILRINSPGGTVSASDTMYREVRRFASISKKPVIASLGEVAASGGYYLALAADEIIAQPTTITASIGVIMPTMNFSEGLNRIGIYSRSIKSGANKDLANPLEPMRDAQYVVLQGMVDEFYGRFRGLVVERRPTLNAPIEQVADGRIVTGAEAVRVGLADSEGDIREAFDSAKRRAGLKAATLVKLHSPIAQVPRTPYASTDIRPSAAHGAPDAGTDINLLQLNLSGSESLSGSGASVYYLWMPAIP